MIIFCKTHKFEYKIFFFLPKIRQARLQFFFFNKFFTWFLSNLKISNAFSVFVRYNYNLEFYKGSYLNINARKNTPSKEYDLAKLKKLPIKLWINIKSISDLFLIYFSGRFFLIGRNFII